MRSVYIAGPYSSPDDGQVIANMFRAAEVAAHYYREKWAVFCPHTMTHLIDEEFNAEGKITYDDWMGVDIYWLKKCDAIHMLPGWRDSKGASMEYLVAKGLGLEILGEVE